MTTITAPQTALDGLKRSLRDVDATALFAAPRIMRRVIREDRELTGPLFNVPHRKTYLIRSDRLLHYVEREELELPADEPLPPLVILITRPNEERLAEIDERAAAAKYWRLLFHARIHAALDERIAAGRLTPADVRRRIERIGQASFDEIQAVLKQEHYLFPSPTPTDVYVEFAAVYLELRSFSPGWLPSYFPSLQDYPQIDALLADDVDAGELFRSTRLVGAPDPEWSVPVAHEEETAERTLRAAVAEESRPRPRRSRKLDTRADRAAARGNSVGAALLRLQAARRAAPDDADDLSQAALADLRELVRRLQSALAFSDSEAVRWRSTLIGLLRNATTGFWNADKRLLYDLQKVCVDHEREIYTVDLLEWLMTFGRRPIKRPLPNQREVLLAKHLRRATARLTSTRLAGTERRRLSDLLHDAAESAEHQLRDRLRPIVDAGLDEKGFAPDNVPERVARGKLVEELLDQVVLRGYLTLGHLRDAIARSDLKLPDLAGPRELFGGDPLLRTDRRLAESLDGVYHRGEFYLRWLQRLSAAAFGTVTGRLLTRFIAIPFGGAFVALEGVQHALEWVVEPPPHVSGWPSILAGGAFLLLMIHVPVFRRAVSESLRLLFRAVRGVLFDGPRWLASRPFVRAMLHSRPVVAARRYLLVPAALTLLVWLVLPWGFGYRRQSPALAAAMMAVLVVLLNSRMGRNLEEITAEWTERTWYRIRVRVFVALYEAIMDAFKRSLEWVERVLYAVDEWLQFRSGQTALTLAAKAVLGLFWGIIISFVRFCVTLLIEPQINPIKHFPVVTVSHKILLPTTPTLASLLAGPLGRAWGGTVAVGIVTTLPGVFGFLVWELKSNWQLYEANRRRTLRPVLIGSHGETLVRFLRPGFHSGTVPKLFAKLRRAERKAALPRYRTTRRKLRDKLHHVEVELRHFIDREFVALLKESRGWGGTPVRVGAIALASNSVMIDLHRPGRDGVVRIAFQEQSGWLVAGIVSAGWIDDLNLSQRRVLADALAGLYKRGGVTLVREQIHGCLGPAAPAYDVRESALIVWPCADDDTEIQYDLQRHSLIRPRPVALAAAQNLQPVWAHELIFAETPIHWADWADAWEADRLGHTNPEPLHASVRLLPPEPPAQHVRSA